MIKLIVPNMASWGNQELMLLTKTVNELIVAEVDSRRQILDVRNKITDIEKELDYLKQAVRNYG